MTYLELQLLINEAYANFTEKYILTKRLGSQEMYPIRELYFVKAVYKTLMNQDGDENKDLLSKSQIQDVIKLFNKYSNSTIQVEYD